MIQKIIYIGLEYLKTEQKNIPSIKHLKEERQPVSLDKEAYVGNYTIYVFDPVKI